MMNKLNSITYRITGLMFLAIALTVFLLIYLADRQMVDLFQQYLVVQHRGMVQGGQSVGTPAVTFVMGQLEREFLASVHDSLRWVGAGLLVLGLAASYLLARSITIPIRKLGEAAEQVAQGNFGQTVPIQTDDEVGNLARVFNRMSQTLETNAVLKRRLLANIAHDLRTPLAVIQGNLEGMIDGVIESTPEQLQSLHEEAVRLNRLIADLRDLSLAEAGQLALEKAPVDINGLIDRAVSMLRPLADEKAIAIRCELAAEIPTLLLDSDRMHQVLYNLLTNAIRYSPAQGEIRVRTMLLREGERSWVKLLFADQGPGIAPEDLPHVFDHFYRGDKSRDRKSGGSGLGLAIVKQLVENHGGRVSVTSCLGEGCVFQLLLPAGNAAGTGPFPV